MPSLIEALQAFNRRERQILVGWVLDRITFPLGYEFRDVLSGVLSPLRVPADSYVAMDYTLNWLAAALMWSSGEVTGHDVEVQNPATGVDVQDISDTDLLVAFAHGSETHLVLLEAKGYTKWDTQQLKRKIERLSTIFGHDGERFASVIPHWVFVSPGPPPNLNWAKWMVDPSTGAPHYLPLPQPAGHKLAIGRCDENGKKKDGGYWTIRESPWPTPSTSSARLEVEMDVEGEPG